jgi:hypothetical protein
VIVTGTLRFKEHTMTSTATGNKEISRVRFNTPNLAAPHATETLTLNTHLIGPGSKVKIKLALHVVLTGQGIRKVVINTAKGPCGPT